jgi:NADH dehydrogenase FAD-containing subunit
MFSFFSSPLTAPDSPVDIVIVGASYAGTKVAQELARKIIAAKWQNVSVTIIDRNQSMHHSMSSPRAIVSPKYAEASWVPYDKLFPNNVDPKQFKFVNATVTSITDSKVVAQDGQEIPYTHLVIASGSSNRQPMKLDTPNGLETQKSIAEAIKNAESVLLVGGGAAGVETAAEIATHYPSKNILLYESGPRLLNNQHPPVSEKLANHTKQRMEALGVQVFLGERVQVPSEIWTDSTWIGLSRRSFPTTSGSVETDVQLLLTGNASFNSNFIKSFDESVIAESGEVKTQNTYQVPGHPNWFALGDVAQTGASKQAALIRDQVPVLVSNLMTFISSPDTPLKTYDFSKNSSMLALTFGVNDGAGDLGPLGAQVGWIGRKVVGSFKSDMMVAMTWGDLGFSKKDIPSLE